MEMVFKKFQFRITTLVLVVVLQILSLKGFAFLEEPYKTVACRACLTENDNSHYCYRKERPFVSCCPAESFTMDCLAITNFDQLCSEVRQEPQDFKLEMLGNCPIFEEDSECGQLVITLDYNNPNFELSRSNAYLDEKFCNYDIKVKNIDNLDQYSVDIVITSDDVATALVINGKSAPLMGISLAEIKTLKTNLVISATELESMTFKIAITVSFNLAGLYQTVTITIGVLFTLLMIVLMLLCLQMYRKIDLKQLLNPNRQTQAEIDEEELRQAMNEEDKKKDALFAEASDKKKALQAPINQNDSFFGVDEWCEFDDPNSKMDFQKFEQQENPDYTREILDGQKASSKRKGPMHVLQVGSPSNSAVLTSCDVEMGKKPIQTSKSLSKVQPDAFQEPAAQASFKVEDKQAPGSRKDNSQQNLKPGKGGQQEVSGFKDQQNVQGGLGMAKDKHVELSVEELDEMKLKQQMKHDEIGDKSPLRASHTQVVGGGFKEAANKLQPMDKDFDKVSIQSHANDLNPSRANKGQDEGGQQASEKDSVLQTQLRSKSALKTQKSVTSKAEGVRFADKEHNQD